MKQWIIGILLLLACSLSAQVISYEGLFAGSATFSFSTGGTSDATGTITKFRDQTALGFKLSRLEEGDVLVSSNGSLWRVVIINSKSVARADVDVERISSFGIKPSGNGHIGRPSPVCSLLPFATTNTFGLSAKTQAEIENYNTRALDTCVVQRGRVDRVAVVQDSVLLSLNPQGDTLSIDTIRVAGGGVADVDLSFDSDRPILRTPGVNTIIGGSTINEWLEWWYFRAPTMSLNQSPSTSVFEIGTNNNLTYSGSTTNSGGATLSGGVLQRTSPGTNTINTFGAGSSYSQSITYQPRPTGTNDYNRDQYSFRARQDWVFGAENGTAQSSTRTIYGVFPVLYGVSPTDLSQGGNAYTTLTKLVTREGNKTVTLNGDGFIYYAIPATWNDTNLSAIIDHNGFNVTPSFTRFASITVSSTGLPVNWTQTYILYKLNNLTSTNGFAYQFNR